MIGIYTNRLETSRKQVVVPATGHNYVNGSCGISGEKNQIITTVHSIFRHHQELKFVIRMEVSFMQKLRELLLQVHMLNRLQAMAISKQKKSMMAIH